MAKPPKKWLDSIEKQKRSNVCNEQTDRRTHSHTDRQSQRQKNNRLLARCGHQKRREKQHNSDNDVKLAPDNL